MKEEVKKPFAIPEFNSPKNWVADYEFENGNYICHCIKCDEYFFGYKRRVICFECNKELE